MATQQEFDFSVNLLKALLWQNNTSARLQALLQAKQDWYSVNQTQFWQDWFTNVFDLRTANNFGCVVWAIILGVPIALIVGPQNNGYPPLGFDVFNKTNFFGNANFTANNSSTISFSLAEKRLILMLRARKLVSKGSIPETNKILADLIVPVYGACYMRDGLDMTITLVTTFPLSANLNVILTGLDLLPRGAAVQLKLITP